MEQQELYEPPVVVELGEFAELTRGPITYGHADWYLGYYVITGTRG